MMGSSSFPRPQGGSQREYRCHGRTEEEGQAGPGPRPAEVEVLDADGPVHQGMEGLGRSIRRAHAGLGFRSGGPLARRVCEGARFRATSGALNMARKMSVWSAPLTDFDLREAE